MHLKNLRLGFLVIFLCIYSNIAGVGASTEAVTGCKEIEIIHRASICVLRRKSCELSHVIYLKLTIFMIVSPFPRLNDG